MKKSIRKWISCAVIAGMAALMLPYQAMTAYAAEAKITFSDHSVMVGNEVTVNVKVAATDGALGGADLTLSYDPSVLEFQGGNNASGGAGAIRLVGTMDSDNTTQFSYALKFKTLQAGNTQIAVSNYEIYDKDIQPVTLSHVGSSSVKVTPPATYSSEAALASLTISPGTLSPAFAPDVTSYTANVSGDVEKLAIDARPKDSKAKTVTSGTKLKVGENKVVCKVTAEDGQTTKTYTIQVNRADTPEPSAENPDGGTQTGETGGASVGELKASVNNVEYHVATSFDESALPEGFESATINYQGSEIMAGKGIEKDLTLIYLVDSENSGGFYIYDEESGELSVFVSIEVSEKAIVILPSAQSEEKPAGLTEMTLTVNDHDVTGWVPPGVKDPEYCVFYGMNWNGEKGLYRLDRRQMTFQRYFDDSSAMLSENPEYIRAISEHDSLVGDFNKINLLNKVLIGVSVLLLIIVILLLLKNRGRRDDYDDYDDDEPEQEEMTPVRRRALQREEEARRAERYLRGEEADEAERYLRGGETDETTRYLRGGETGKSERYLHGGETDVSEQYTLGREMRGAETVGRGPAVFGRTGLSEDREIDVENLDDDDDLEIQDIDSETEYEDVEEALSRELKKKEKKSSDDGDDLEFIDLDD